MLVVNSPSHFRSGCRIEFLDYSEFENSIGLVQAIHAASDVAISIYLEFATRDQFVILESLQHFVSAHPFIFRFLLIWGHQPAIACGTRPVERVLLVSLRAFTSVCIVSIRLIIYV